MSIKLSIKCVYTLPRDSQEAGSEGVVLQSDFTSSDLGFVGWLTGGAVLVDEASDGVVAFDPGWDQGMMAGSLLGVSCGGLGGAGGC